MSFLMIDQEKCKRDHICVAECPLKLIQCLEKDDYPTPAPLAEEICVSCGHCISVCPQGAISIKSLSSNDCIPMNRESLPSAYQVEHFLKSRRSIRSFKSKPVDHSILEKIIDIARYAPSGHNVQPVHWLVIEDKQEVQHLASYVADWTRLMIEGMPEFAAAMHLDEIVTSWEAGIDRICRNAPHVIIAHAPADLSMSPGSCTIALTYLELAAYSMGLGACWAGYLGIAAGNFPPLIQELKLPEGHQAFGAMMIGYPKYAYHRIPPRTDARVIWR